MGQTTVRQTRHGLHLGNDQVEFAFSPERNGALVSVLDRATGCELIRDRKAPGLLWRLTVRRQDGELEALDSNQAATFAWAEERGEGETTLVMVTGKLPGCAAEVTVRVALADGAALSRWRTEARGLGEGLAPVELACPIISGLVKLGDPAPGECLLAPIQSEGYLFRDPFPVRDRLPLCSGAGPETANVGIGRAGGRYPGSIALQMMALYNDQAGLYFAAHDAGQHPKDLAMGPWEGLGDGPVLSVTHLLTETPGAGIAMPYDTVVGVFHGDWYDAAAIYKDWATRQWWCERKLWDRDIPDWLRTGVGGVWQMSNYHLPKLDLNHSLDLIADTVNETAADAGVPLLGLVFNWEGGGAWTGPRGFFPPRAGEEPFRAAMDRLRGAGNHGFVYITGGCWYIRNAYDPPFDSSAAFETEGRPHAIVQADGEVPIGRWYAGWEATRLCPATDYATELHADILLGCLERGCRVVQIDNFPCGGSEACYSPSHGHPPGHGPWWSEAWGRVLAEMRQRARALHPDCALSTEGVSEGFIPWLDLYDQRAPNMEYFGHYGPGLPMGGEAVPLFGYVYGEYLGAYCAAMPEANRPEVLYWTRCLGKAICQGVLPSAGRYFPDPPASNPVTLAFYQRIVRATGRELYPYLMFGEMLRPPDIEVPEIAAQYCKFVLGTVEQGHHMDPAQRHEVRDRAVQHAAYRGRDGSVALVFANVSEEPVAFDVELPEYDLSGPVSVARFTNSAREECPEALSLPSATRLSMEPLSVTVLVVREPDRPGG